MIQTAAYNHEIFSKDDTIEIESKIYQGDLGSMEITVSITKNHADVDLSGYVVSVTNRAPNGAMLMVIGGQEKPLVVDGHRIVWTLQGFDTQQVGTYLAQLHVATDTQTVTVVFLKYNVERSVSGNIVTAPAQYATLSTLVFEVDKLRADVAEMECKTDEIRGLYDLFASIIEDGGVTWNTLYGKPDTFPPSPHSHAEFATLQSEITTIARNQDGMKYEIGQINVEIPADGWVYNNLKLRYEYTIQSEDITHDRDVCISVSDEDNGTLDLHALRPQDGSVTVYTYSHMAKALPLLLAVTAVFTNGGGDE